MLHKDLREFIELLISRNIDFLLIGGHAVAFHGHPRTTGDIDFLIRPTELNARRLAGVLIEFGFAPASVDPEDFQRPGRVVQLGLPPNRIDLLTSISGVDIDEAWSGRTAGTVDGLSVFFLGLNELRKNKRASGRAKDLADLEALGDA